MKKTTLFALLMGSVGVAHAFDAGNGTLTLNAEVTDNGTCIITGLDKTYTFPDVTKAQLTAAGNDSKIVGQVLMPVQAIGCPEGLTKVNAVVDYARNSAAPALPQTAPLPEVTGVGKGIAIWLYQGSAGKGVYRMPGQTIVYPINADTHESGDMGSSALEYGQYNAANPIVAGAFSSVINYTISFE